MFSVLIWSLSFLLTLDNDILDTKKIDPSILQLQVVS